MQREKTLAMAFSMLVRSAKTGMTRPSSRRESSSIA